MEGFESCTQRQAAADWVLREIKKRSAGQRTLLLAIDGRCAAGKTTLAAHLHRACGCGVVHLDHFFPRPEQRTKERFETPGGNVDYERFLAEALLPLHRGEAAEYRPFNCAAQRLAAPVRVDPSPLIVVEGAYACHPAFWSYYDLKIFLTVPAPEQMRRITARNGPQAAQVFRTRWIPLEEQYFSAFQIAARCDRCFDTTDSRAPL